MTGWMPVNMAIMTTNRGQWEQGCSLFMATDLGPVRATHRKKKNCCVSVQHAKIQKVAVLAHERII